MSEPQYVLGHHDEELARLDHQAAAIEPATRILLQSSGITPGMRVLDLGTGLGHVARLAGELVGPAGRVVGVDQSGDALVVARERTIATGATHVTFVEANATLWHAPEPFDAITGRLLLFHMADPVAVVRHQLSNLRPSGLFVAIDYDIGNSRSEPHVPLAETALHWIEAAFRAAGAWPRIGPRLGTILEAAGLTGVTTYGIQPYLPAGSPAGASLIAGVVRSLAPAIVRHGIATEQQLDIATLEQRLAEAISQSGAVVLPPTVAAAWGHAPLAQ